MGNKQTELNNSGNRVETVPVWVKFQADVERQFLRPEKSEMKWQ